MASVDDDFLDDPELDAGIETRLPWLDNPLDHRKRQVRILRLHPILKESRSVLKGTLSVVDLDLQPQYETLSYVWGTAPVTGDTPFKILLNSIETPVTRNLFEFLQQLRLPNLGRNIWVDALCIDQADEREKQHQLQLMNQVYRQGSDAHVWFGRLDESWQSDIPCDNYNYVPTIAMTDALWKNAESVAQEELHHYVKEGGRAPRASDYLRLREGQTWQRTFAEAFDVLDGVIGGKQMHDFPLYLQREGQLIMNRHWPTLFDCIRWLATREWWNRVWTYQEAILPLTGSTIHTTSLSFPLTKVLDGIFEMRELFHKEQRMIRHTKVFWADYQNFDNTCFSQIHRLREQRRNYNKKADGGLSIMTNIYGTQLREASRACDHFYGFLAVLPASLQEHWAEFVRDICSGVPSTAQAFSYCTINVFCRGDAPTLRRLDCAIGLEPSQIDGLPTWAIDLSNHPSHDKAKDSCPWDFHNASLGAVYDIPEMSQFLTHDPIAAIKWLVVEAIPVATLSQMSCLGEVKPSTLPTLVAGWKRLYRDCNPDKPLDEHKFWRTAFMNRDIWLYVGHQRRPLSFNRVADIIRWWRHYEKTGSRRDLHVDKRMADGTYGTYHYRALAVNAETHRFFVTTAGEPGMGPRLMQPGDEIFVLKGCKALVMLRRSDTGPLDLKTFKFVGLCFVEGCMNGEVLQRDSDWTTMIVE